MKKRKIFFDLAPLFLMWLMVSVFFWGWIFNFLTDTSAEKKIVLYADAPVPDATALSVAMEALGAEGIDMVQARPFTYAMMGGSGLDKADLYIVSASQAAEYKEWFAPLPEAVRTADAFVLDGVPMGLPVDGAASSFIAYGEEDYFLFFGNGSRHVPGNAGAADDLAIPYARHFLTLE